MLDDTLKSQLAAYLAHLKQPITLTIAKDDSTASRELVELLGEIAAASSLVTVSEGAVESGTRTPSFSVARTGEPPRVTFAGLPLGHEFTSLVLALQCQQDVDRQGNGAIHCRLLWPELKRGCQRAAPFQHSGFPAAGQFFAMGLAMAGRSQMRFHAVGSVVQDQ